MRWPSILQAFLLAPALLASAEETATATRVEPACTISASAAGGIGGFFDLRPDIAAKKEEDKPHPYKGVMTTDYKANGWDYKHNFTLNICAPVVKTPEDVKGVEEKLWKNISAYYMDGDYAYSLGQSSMDLKSRGRKLVLQYKGGSPCGKKSSKREVNPVRDGATYKYEDYPDDDDVSTSSDEQKPSSGDEERDETRRKSMTISFLCDHDPSNSQAGVSFVGTDPDECAYFFEVRSRHACVSAEPNQPGGVGPGGVFALIFGIALVVYFAGGVFYQRTVAHARGWRQLPNYNLWHSIWSFVTDILVILTASCARFLPSRRGYGRLAISPTGRGRNREDENRLIDQLDEEWDD